MRNATSRDAVDVLMYHESVAYAWRRSDMRDTAEAATWMARKREVAGAEVPVTCVAASECVLNEALEYEHRTVKHALPPAAGT
jgi:hypothetical protein